LKAERERPDADERQSVRFLAGIRHKGQRRGPRRAAGTVEERAAMSVWKRTIGSASVLLWLAGVAEAAFVLVPRGGTVDVDSDGTADLMVEQCTDCGALPNRIVHLNASFRGFSARTYALTDCTDVASASFSSNGPFIPSSFEVVLVKSNTNGFGKLQHNDVSTAAGMELEWQALGCTPVSPPDTDFTFTTYDLLAFFTDTSVSDPATSWSWTFGDGATSLAAGPAHAYAAAGTYNVCLTASNSGGAGPTTCKDVTVATVPSTTVSVGGSIDLDGDAVNDLQVLPTGACGATPNLLRPLGSARWTAISMDYRTVTIADAPTPTSASDFCHPVADLFATGIVQGSNGSIVKFWTPQNTGAGVRFEFAILQNTVSPPDSDFTFTTYDLVAFFTDTSANDPATSWSWTFGDGGTSAAPNPFHAYAAAATYDACLTATNVGGAGPTTCKDVAVATVPSTTVSVGGSIDFDGDAVNDLQVLATAACGAIPNMLRPLGSVEWASLAMDYRLVTIGDVPDPASTSDFCHPVSDLFATGVVRTSNGSLAKFWTPQNTGAGGIRFEFAILFNSVSPPDTDFTFTTYDLVAFFTDTSVSDPATSWSWTFGDGGTSAVRNPSHAYAAAGTYDVCLTAANLGGAGPMACQDVTVAAVPSTFVPSGGSIDFDGDSIDDLMVLATTACSGGVPHILRPLGPARWASITKDYRTVTLSDAPDPLNTSDFCHAVADVFETGFVKTAKGTLVKFWTPANDAGGVRFEFALLSAAASGLRFHTLSPCRVVDTRGPAGPLGGPALGAGADRPFAVRSACGIPATAQALAVNVTITGATAAGNLRLHPGGTAVPATSTINYEAGRIRANNAVVALSASGEVAVYAGQAAGSVHFILDVAGYFE
jgi:PKD repeat protein